MAMGSGSSPMRCEESYDDFLLAIGEMTEADLRAAMELIPADVRSSLSMGPVERRYGCAVCEAFGKGFYSTGSHDSADPMWRVFGYHEQPKARMRFAREEHDGPLANEVYVRCLATYRAAGWVGEAEGANA